VCAENPDAGFLPAIGTMSVARWPAHVRFVHDPVRPRIDTGFGEGDEISPHYDSMVAKLIVWGEDRGQALARLDAALRDTHIVGLQTNVAFLRRVAASRSFREADLDTALIERERAALFEAPPLPLEVAAAGAVAHALAVEAAEEGPDPWSRRDGWRMHGGATRHFDLEVGDGRCTARLERAHDGALALSVQSAGRPEPAVRMPFGARGLGDHRHDVTLGTARWTLAVYAVGERLAVFAPQGQRELREVDALAHAGESARPEGRLAAPMPGKVVSILVKAGDKVTQGQPLAVMEAMKMEHTLSAPRDGEVAELLYAPGDPVSEGAELLRLA
jgi:3-methylcrotonyl-CoA carboxylase alpha subunit